MKGESFGKRLPLHMTTNSVTAVPFFTSFTNRTENARRNKKESTPSKASFAGELQTRHESIAMCREVLAWLGNETDCLEAKCTALCHTSAELPVRTEKRLSRAMEHAAATAAQKRSVVARRLQSVSSTWGEEIPRRRHRHVHCST